MPLIRIVDVVDEPTFGLVPPCADPAFDHRSCDYWEDADRGSKRARPMGPATGPLADGDVGAGRLSELSELTEGVKALFAGAPLAGKKVSPHTLRHTTAMHLLQAGVDVTVIALWLGHESPETTHQYVEADVEMKRRVLDKLDEPEVKAGRPRCCAAWLRGCRLRRAFHPMRR